MTAREQLQILHGDLVRSDEPVIAHGCNTRGIMGAGIAQQIAKQHPLVLHANERDVKAGSFLPGSAQLVIVSPRRAVFNLGTQEDVGPCAKLEYIYLAFRNLAEKCAHDSITRLAIPQIGCGLGGLFWTNVEKTINLGLGHTRARGHELEVVCYVYQPGKPIK